MAKGYVPIFFEWLEVTQDLTQAEKGNLIDAAVLYATGGDWEKVLTGVEKIAFRFIKGQIDRNESISEIRRQARIGKTEQNVTKDNKTEQTITNDNKTEQTTSNSLKEKEKEKENKKRETERLFAQFWAAYPRHEAKTTAMKAFTKLNPDDEMLKKMVDAIEKQKRTQQWNENGGQFVPYPSTWLNQRRWEDEITQISQNPATSYEQRDYTGVQDEAVRQMMAWNPEVDEA